MGSEMCIRDSKRIMFEKKKNKKLKQIFNLPEYNLDFSDANPYLSSVSLKIENNCEIMCSLEIRQSDNSEESGTISTSLSSFSNKFKLKYGKYTQR